MRWCTTAQESTDEHYMRQVRQKIHDDTDKPDRTGPATDVRSRRSPDACDAPRDKRAKTTERTAAIAQMHAEVTDAANAQQQAKRAAGVASAATRAATYGSTTASAASATLPPTSAAAAPVDYEASPRTCRGSHTRLDCLHADELLYLLRRERQDKSAIERDLAHARIARAIAERRAEKAEAAARALPETKRELAQAQGELRGVHALRKRLELVEAGSAALRAAGLNDFFDGFARAIDRGKLVLTSIGAHRLSEWSRNIRVHPNQRRYPGTRQFWSYVSKKHSGMTAIEEICGDDDPRFQGEPTPSRDTVRQEVKQAVGGFKAGGIIHAGIAEFVAHLRMLATQLRERGSEDALAAEALAAPEMVMDYRTAADATACSVKLTVNPKDGSYTGDEDLSALGLGVDPKALAAQRRRYMSAINSVISPVGGCSGRAIAVVLAEVLGMIGGDGVAALEKEERRLAREIATRIERYTKRQSKGKGQPARATSGGGGGGERDGGGGVGGVGGGERGTGEIGTGSGGGGADHSGDDGSGGGVTEAAATGRCTDASGPLTGTWDARARQPAKQLVGRVVLQRFPDCALRPDEPYRGRLTELLPASKAREYVGQVWYRVVYEDGDAQEREITDLLANASLVPFSKMTEAELSALDPSALSAELRARAVTLPRGACKDAKQLAALYLRPPKPKGARKRAATEAAAGGEGGGGEGGGGEGGANGGVKEGANGAEVPDMMVSPEEMTRRFNAKQIAELTALQSEHAAAAAKLGRCRRALQHADFDASETKSDMIDRLAALGPVWMATVALALSPEVEDISLSLRMPADKVMVFRARDMLHIRSVTIARFWLSGASCTEKMEAMAAFVHGRLHRELKLALEGEVLPRHVAFVADKENCNKFLWGGNGGKPRNDGVPHTLRVLAYDVAARVGVAKAAALPPSELPPCDRHWSEALDSHAPLTAEQQRVAEELGFDEESWVADDWDGIPGWDDLGGSAKAAAASLGFTPRTWKGGGGPAPSDTPTNVAKKRCSLAHFRARAPSQLPEMQMDVLGMQLHRPKLDPPPASPAAAAEAPAVSSAVRSCARGAIAGVLTTCRQEGEDAVVRWVINEIAVRGQSFATRYRRARSMPPMLRELTLHLNNFREDRAVHALEAAYPLKPPSTPASPATMGGVPISIPNLWQQSHLPHTERFGAVATATTTRDKQGRVVRDDQGNIRVHIHLSIRAPAARCGFANVSQLLTERRMELAVDDPAVKAEDMWDECGLQEMHARRIELARNEGIRFDRRYYHPYPVAPTSTQHEYLGLAFCEPHNMKTSGQNIAGMATKPEENILIKHAHLLEVARELAAEDRRHAALVAALQKSVDMQSQPVFGNLFSCAALLNRLRSKGYMREWALMKVLGLRWRACDQRGMSRALRTLAIEGLDVLMNANICGRSLFCPCGGAKSVRAARHHVGVRSSHFQGLPWETLLGRLSNDAVVGWLSEVLSPAIWPLWVLRTLSQNDLESLFGCVVSGLPTKPPPCLMEPNFQDAEFVDLVRNDSARAEMWKTNLSKKKKYDATDGIESLAEAFAFCSGAGDRLDSELAVAWVDKQQLGAMRAAQGRQESARTFNTFHSGAKAIAEGGIKRRAVGE